MPNAIFRADASPEGGGGHIMRCMALAEALSDLGWLCRFAVRPPTLETMSALRTSGYEVMDLMSDEDSEPPELAARWPDGVDWLIVDHYGRDATFESACRPWARRIMVIDDLADRPHDCDVLLDQTLGRTTAAYAGHVPDDCRLLLGPAYALLRPEFARARPAALARRQENGPVRRILVSMGATDPANVTSLVLDGIGQSRIDAEIDVALDASAPHLDAVCARAERLPQEPTVHVGSEDMAELMARADLAIGAAGVSSLERCCLGLPSLVVVTADNQGKIAHGLERAGAIRLLGRREDLSPQCIAEVVLALARDEGARAEMSARAAAICTGTGIHLVVGEIAALCGPEAAMVQARP